MHAYTHTTVHTHPVDTDPDCCSRCLFSLFKKKFIFFKASPRRLVHGGQRFPKRNCTCVCRHECVFLSFIRQLAICWQSTVWFALSVTISRSDQNIKHVENKIKISQLGLFPVCYKTNTIHIHDDKQHEILRGVCEEFFMPSQFGCTRRPSMLRLSGSYPTLRIELIKH